MKYVNKDSMSYIGSVNVSLKKINSNFTFYNDGTPELFKSLSRFLCGYGVDNMIPNTIGLKAYLTDGQSSNCLRSGNNLPISRRVVSNDGSAIFTSLLNRQDIASMPPDLNTVKYFELTMFSISGVALATVQVSSAVIAEVYNGNGVEALIEWKMQFKNAEKEPEEENNAEVSENE